MRAKQVKSISHIFDFDDTLVKSDVKTHVYDRSGQYVKSLTPAEYNLYKKRPGDTLDMSDFDNPALIADAETYIMWPLLEKYDQENDSVLYILTARHASARDAIYNFLINKGINNLPMENIFAVGDNVGAINIPLEKRKVLELITKQHSTNNFYDDNVDTIDYVKDIPHLFAYFVE